MIEVIILKYLEEKLSIPVYLETPEKPPKRYIVMEKTGSTKKNYINSATLAIQSVAESLFWAAQINKEIIISMEDVINLNEIGAVELNSDYNFTDTATKRYRYQAVFEIKYY